MIRGLAIALLAASCSYADRVFIAGLPDDSAASALLAVHHDDAVDVLALALPAERAIEPAVLTGDESAWLELLYFDDPVERLFVQAGSLVDGSGADPIPAEDAIYTAALFDDGAPWQPAEARSGELDVFRYDDPRADPCAPLDVKTISLQADRALGELLVDDEGALFALLDLRPGLFRIDDEGSTPIDVDPPVAAASAAFLDGELWIITSSGALHSGVIDGDRLSLTAAGETGTSSIAWMIPNPYRGGGGFIGLSRRSRLFDLATGASIHQLPSTGGTEQGTLAFLDGAVYFTTNESRAIGRWDGAAVEELAIPDDDLGSGVGFVEGVGVLVSTVNGRIFRVAGDALMPFEVIGAAHANVLLPFPGGGGFMVGSDYGLLFRWIDDRTCLIPQLSPEDFELAVPFDGGVAFGPTSNSDRRDVGGPTPVTLVRPR